MRHPSSGDGVFCGVDQTAEFDNGVELTLKVFETCHVVGKTLSVIKSLIGGTHRVDVAYLAIGSRDIGVFYTAPVNDAVAVLDDCHEAGVVVDIAILYFHEFSKVVNKEFGIITSVERGEGVNGGSHFGISLGCVGVAWAV